VLRRRYFMAGRFYTLQSNSVHGNGEGSNNRHQRRGTRRVVWGGEVQKVTVYNYWTWVPGEGLGKIACKKRTRQQIEERSGILIRVTGAQVDEADLSLDGSYRPQTFDEPSRKPQSSCG
jgi:hypothetical protein